MYLGKILSKNKLHKSIHKTGVKKTGHHLFIISEKHSIVRSATITELGR
jgi:hypothetical protein